MSQKEISPSCPARFDVAVPDSGYRWWYVDGVSHDGRYGLVVIAFLGSVFSPYYFRARQRGPASPESYTSINVCLYRPGGDRWAMTERSRRSLVRNARSFRVGSSQLAWEDGRLVGAIEERSAPFARRMVGKIELKPRVLNTERFRLDAGGRHVWRPVAPVAEISVDFSAPACKWTGHAYCDTNYGERMLELDFATWDWSRTAAADGTSIYYVARSLQDGESRLGVHYAADGTHERLAVPDPQALAKSGWRVARQPSSPVPVTLSRVFEDTPFYTRNLLHDPDGGMIVHESLDMLRFKSSWVRTLLPFRMPRIA